MSVINKMLRDLDASARPRDAAPGQSSIAAGTVPVAAGAGRFRPQNDKPKWAVVTALAGLTFLGGTTAWWWWHTSAPSRLPSAPALLSQPGNPVSAPAPIPAIVPPGPVASNSPALAATAPPAVVAPSPGLAAQTLRPSGDPSAVKAVPVTPVKAPSATAQASTAPAASAAVAAAPPQVAPATPGPSLTAARSAAPTDMLEDAQKLWDKGAREAAVQLLRERLDVADALVQAGGSPATLWLWASELTRMEVAQGQSAQALRRLERLESHLSSNASAWATRGNLAQRLGRHAESAQAYLAALAIRPEEPRWMLGAAVSLAADGRTAQAADWARRAQARGALNPEVAAFLRQQGVALP